MDNLEEMDKLLLERYNFPKLNQEEVAVSEVRKTSKGGGQVGEIKTHLRWYLAVH